MEINDIICLIFERKNGKNYNPDENNIEESHLIKEIKNKIKLNTKESNIKINNEEEEIFTIPLSESEKISESNDKINENEIKKIIQENMKEIDISSKIEKLIGLIKINQEWKKNNKDNIEEINGEYLYKLWINSFQNLKYKRNKQYKIYNPEKKNNEIRKNGRISLQLIKRK